jgi:hypothetical protein
MSMVLDQVFERFARYSPVTVMMRGILEHALPPERLDELFREHAEQQYEDELLWYVPVHKKSSVERRIALATFWELGFPSSFGWR